MSSRWEPAGNWFWLQTYEPMAWALNYIDLDFWLTKLWGNKWVLFQVRKEKVLWRFLCCSCHQPLMLPAPHSVPEPELILDFKFLGLVELQTILELRIQADPNTAWAMEVPMELSNSQSSPIPLSSLSSACLARILVHRCVNTLCVLIFMFLSQTVSF